MATAADRLLAVLAGLAPTHPLDAGILGEYAFMGRSRGPQVAAETYPGVAAHLREGCERCERDLEALAGLARRSGQAGAAPSRSHAANAPATPIRQPTQASDDGSSVARDGDGSDDVPPPEPVEVADAVALARVIEGEQESLRGALRPDRFGQVDTRRESARRRHTLLVEAALVRQRLLARQLFLDRALAGRRPGGRPQNPKAGLLLDDFAALVDDLGRFAARIGRLLTDLHRLGDDPSGPARPTSEALTERGRALTRDALSLDRRLVKLQGPLAGMV